MKETEKTLKVRLYTGIGGSVWTSNNGAVYNAKRGDVLEFPLVQGLRMLASGDASETLDGPMPHRIGPETAEAQKAAKHPALIEYNLRQQPPKPVACGGIYDPSPVNFAKPKGYF
ncbi:hypothetical protein [Mycobacterium sp. 852002-40037_SCH5390672]|uniref:hypothetical protein n=1 Tax=Mycobacterium sp. 852002-40037_SCH5390672 TaxID=1834089 RepID=UPI000805837D|nr:hypothetical protein [Mycobacterium sp. 852002-40037_SCH5390672]OBB99765.1 hypothetical protein A5782_21740 [Mycobacterium sp. 852002-40037_SCH5390672]